MASAGEGHGFRFLFRTDRGTITRATWWRGTLPIVGLILIATLIWRVVRPYTEHGLEQPPLAVLGAYLYLLAFAFGVLVLLVCEYNLSAKRFSARGLPRALASLLPLSLLLAGAFHWYLPRSQGLLPQWSAWVAGVALAGVVAWNIVELGWRDTR